MSMSGSQSSKANTRRCPQCRRRIRPLAMHCKNCDWKLPGRFLVQGLIAAGIGLVLVGAYLGFTKTSNSGGTSNFNIERPTPPKQ